MNVNSNSGGYPVEWFINKPSAHLSCGICLDVLKDPQLCKNGHNFCLSCISTALESNEECPTCKCELNVDSLVGNLIVKNMIDEMEVKCNVEHAETGKSCDWSGSLVESQYHFRHCGKRLVDCPLGVVHLCSDVTCTGRVHRNEIKNHITEQNETMLSEVVCMMSETIALQAEENRLLRVLCLNEDAEIDDDGDFPMRGTSNDNGNDHGICLKKLDDRTNGNYFLGHFKDGVRCGFGVERRGGDVYRGQWKDDQKCGQGFYSAVEKTSHAFYSGGFKESEYHGLGKYIDTNRFSYVGEFNKDAFCGEGTISFANGDVGTGRFEDSMMTSGILTYTDGSVFEGSMASHRIFKKGTFTGADGVVFSGTFTATASNINVSGKGAITYTDGTVYTGEFKNAQRHGKGKYVDAAGVVSEGVWANDQLASSASRSSPAATSKKTQRTTGTSGNQVKRRRK